MIVIGKVMMIIMVTVLLVMVLMMVFIMVIMMVMVMRCIKMHSCCDCKTRCCLREKIPISWFFTKKTFEVVSN